MDSGALVAVDELRSNTLELRNKHPCCFRLSLFLTLYLTTIMFVLIINLTCFKLTSKKYKIKNVT